MFTNCKKLNLRNIPSKFNNYSIEFELFDNN